MMDGLFLSKGIYPQQYLSDCAAYILDVQMSDGRIPWFKGGKTDPWDHVEAAMGLSVAGEYQAAEAAYHWLFKQQLADGSWWAAYYDAMPNDRSQRETNFVAYVATGIWHHYLVSADKAFLVQYYPMVQRAIDFVLSYQTEYGDIYWAVDEQGIGQPDALVTACASIYKSIECAINIAATLEQDAASWRRAYEMLGQALRDKPERFDRTWESKSRFSMDWFYPVLAGLYSARDARKRLTSRWDQFVESNLGCRCVSDQPWVTVAESCELTMALLAAGDHAQAVKLYSWLHQWRDNDGGYWTGYQFVDKAIWPEEKTTWTAGAILLAADALTEHTAASRLFLSANLLPAPQDTQCVDGRQRLK
ncbi:hypothetical protein MIB92_12725 [Aestuariirhabdus sp. Z084]|uniref:hypothetical protein n=1 Tax=Aestuariirhabdus haliotis TaxID=2918751 RepID=UPI00201B4568|nr:hypothetical protein [Aestuariirhabdus haliotis]MCL6416516.1 hypothetical protein [Aestuariirhabdus haliotis]MCL6420506.1 hypothetical protein [Aestuariirhabdus haliotis]